MVLGGCCWPDRVLSCSSVRHCGWAWAVRTAFRAVPVLLGLTRARMGRVCEPCLHRPRPRRKLMAFPAAMLLRSGSTPIKSASSRRFRYMLLAHSASVVFIACARVCRASALSCYNLYTPRMVLCMELCKRQPRLLSCRKRQGSSCLNQGCRRLT